MQQRWRQAAAGRVFICALGVEPGKSGAGGSRSGGRFVVQRRSRYELKEADEEKGCADREGGREREREREKEGERRPALVPFKVCYLFKAVQTFTERWQPWNAEAGPRLRAAAVGNRCSPQPLQTRSPSGRVSTQTVPEICGPDSDRSRQQPHAHTHRRAHAHTGKQTRTRKRRTQPSSTRFAAGGAQLGSRPRTL